MFVKQYIPGPIGCCRYLKQFLKEDGIFIVSAPFWEFIGPSHLKMHANLSVEKIFSLPGLQDCKFINNTKRMQ